MDTVSRREFLAAAAATPIALHAPSAVRAAAPPKFQVGLVTYNVAKDWDLPTILKICQDVGIPAVECRTTHKHGVEPSLSADQRADVKRQFADSGVLFWGSGTACEFHSDDPAVVKEKIEECKRFVGLVKDLGGKGVKVRPNGIPKGGDVQKTCEQIGRALVACGKAAEDAGVEIWVEVHGAVTNLPKNMRAIMDACGHKSVGVTWNSNGTDVVNGSVKESFELLKPYIKSCHITDLENDAKGVYPYRELFGLFREMGYDRYTLCEYGKAFAPAEGKEFLTKYKRLWEKLAAA